MSDRGRGGKLTVSMDFISITLIAIMLLTILFGGLGGLDTGSQSSQNLANFLIEFEAVGIIGAIITRTITLTNVGFSTKGFNRELLYIVGNLVGFFLLNLVVPPTVPVFLKQSLTTAPNFATIIIGVPEETLWCQWLAPWFGNVSHTGIVGGTISSAFFRTIFHLFVYGTNPGNLVIVFGVGSISAYSVLRTKHLSVAMATHVVNNAITIFGGI